MGSHLEPIFIIFLCSFLRCIQPCRHEHSLLDPRILLPIIHPAHLILDVEVTAVVGSGEVMFMVSELAGFGYGSAGGSAVGAWAAVRGLIC